MDHNKYLSSCESLSQKWQWKKLRIKVLLTQWGGTKCAFKIFLGIAPLWSHIDRMLMFVEYQSIMIFLWRVNQSGPLQQKKKKKLWDALTIN
jgi:hypothetical protein